jgi:hypothetical protein
MAGWLIIIVAAIYVAIGLDLFFKGSYPMSLVFFSYALGNVGLYWGTL